MLGIALGSFMEGFTRGAVLRQQIDEGRDRAKLRSGIANVTKTGKAEFDAGVKSGKYQADDFDNFYNQKMIPQYANEYRLAGDPAKAAAFTDFADSEAAKKGSRLFASGLQAMQMGDVEGGMADLTKAVNLDGYGPEGKMTAAELYDEGAGAVTGYKVTFTDKNGKEYSKNVAKDDLPKFFAATVNPKAAFETKLASDAEQAKADLEVQTHGRKKLIEKQLGVGDGAITEKDYVKAIADERKRIESDSLTNPEYRDLTGDQKEAMARQIVDQRMGKQSSAPAAPQVYVDPDTGEQVSAPTQQPAAAPTAAPTQGPAPAATTQADQNTAAPAAPVAAPAQPAPNGIVAPTSAAAPTDQRQALIMQAAQEIQKGGDATKIAAALTQAGIPPAEWPAAVKTAAQPGVQ